MYYEVAEQGESANRIWEKSPEQNQQSDKRDCSLWGTEFVIKNRTTSKVMKKKNEKPPGRARMLKSDESML